MMAKQLHPDNRYTLPLATGTSTGTSTGTRGHDGWDEHWNEGPLAHHRGQEDDLDEGGYLACHRRA